MRGKKYHKEHWALRDVNFDVPKGKTVGIVGRNGSGKSTLLQIIAGILTPTAGKVEVNGKVSALLELGSGFNPEFTGRENVLLNGAVSGFSQEEIEARLPFIEGFADIGEFFDQPVKIYSSGMFVRLAFACAINVDPDILIIDEALSVGDAKFQHQCYNKFLEFQEAGKTILFVSHSTDTIVNHCDYAVLLEGGAVVEMGEPKTITNYYLDLLFTGKITGYAHSPVLIEEGYKGFNIVHYRMKYYAFLQSLGPTDLTHANDNELQKYAAEHKCVVGSVWEEVRQIINKIVSTGSDSSDPPAEISLEIHSVKKEKTELEKFLEEVPASDNCVNRKSYNKNEYRYGDRRAEIIDYLIVVGDKYDPVTINSGDVVDMYVKYKFNEDVESPMFGFAIKTVDGVIIYGNNTRLSRVPIPPALKNDIIIIKWTINFTSNSGDFFLNLGVAEKYPSVDMPIDNRKGIVHMHVQTLESFAGLVKFKTVFSEISWNSLPKDLYNTHTRTCITC